MIKKLAVVFCLLAVFLAPLSLSIATFADEEQYQTTESIFKGRTGGNCSLFLGLTSWDCGVDIHTEDSQDGKIKNESLKNGIWQIAANIATDITVIAAYLIIGYVIYGGYLYIFSTGDPGKVASSKKTLLNAFLGLAIVMSAFIIMSTIRFALLKNSSDLTGCIKIAETGEISSACISADAVYTNAINWAIGIAGFVAAIFVVYGGISYITSAGEPAKVAKAKQIILYALIGLAVVGLAFAITSFVSGIIKDAKGKAQSSASNATFNTIVISKEFYEKTA